jgi:hypothetical protein
LISAGKTHGRIADPLERVPSSDVLVLGYGSLMSGRGLVPLGRLRTRGALRLGVHNARRGFAKFSQRGDRFALVLEPLDAEQPIEARVLGPRVKPNGGPEAIGLVVQPADLARLCDREGYSSGALQRLREEAAGRRLDLAGFLWSVLGDAAFDVAEYRKRLFRLLGYTSPHYVPHPVRIAGERYALTFLAPGREGTGSERIVPVRVRTGQDSLMTAAEAWSRKPNPTQLDYLTTCLLGGVHGICLRDLLQPVVEDGTLYERARCAVAEEQPQELARFLSTTGIDHGTYWDTFGPPVEALRRGGLHSFLHGDRL